MILTGVEKVALDYATPAQRFLDRMSVAEAEAHLAQGQFPPGSMGPKIHAACSYLRTGGQRVVITDPLHFTAALDGRTGTLITP